jgi:hypothetical protein
MPSERSEDVQRRRFEHRLAVAADDGFPSYVRLAAVRAIQSILPEGSTLRSASAESLLSRIKQPWETRMHKNAHGRYVEGPVLRPFPTSLRDLW